MATVLYHKFYNWNNDGNSVWNHIGKYWKISEISLFLINQENDKEQKQ